MPPGANPWRRARPGAQPAAREGQTGPLQRPAARKDSAKGTPKKDAAAAKKPSDASQPPKQHHQHGQLWVRDGEFVRPVTIRVGLSDGSMTEVSGTKVKEGMQVVIGEEAAGTAGSGDTNPFLPQIFRSRPKSGSGSDSSSGGGPSNKK